MKNRTDEQVLAAGLTELYANQHSRVLGIVARTLRQEDRAAYAEDLAQDVWLMVWQYLLRGNEIIRPAGLLATFARRRVYAHYRSARVRREMAVDPQQYGPLDRICAELTAAGAVATLTLLPVMACTTTRLTDEEHKELSDKVRKANEDSRNGGGRR
jgi:DNA-directed RNA polymerase specialized sigma24 family protein